MEVGEVDFRAFIEGIPPVSYIVPVGPPGQVCLHLSPQVETMLGFPLADWTGRNSIWPDSVHPEDRERLFAAHDRCSETLEPWDQEYRMIAKDGGLVWIHDQASVVYDDE